MMRNLRTPSWNVQEVRWIVLLLADVNILCNSVQQDLVHYTQNHWHLMKPFSFILFLTLFSLFTPFLSSSSSLLLHLSFLPPPPSFSLLPSHSLFLHFL